MKLFIHFLQITVFILAGHFIYAQSYPGGIGNTAGEPELRLWLLPDSLSYSENDSVDEWVDYSSYNQNLTDNPAYTMPIFRENALNGHDYLEFSNSNNVIRANNFNMPADAVGLYMVYRTSVDGNDDDAIISYNASGFENNYLIIDPETIRTYISGSQNDSGDPMVSGSWSIFSHQWRNSDGRLLMHIDGTEYHNTAHQSGTVLASNGTFAIGGEQDGPDAGYSESQDYDGDLAEVIMYGSSMQQAYRVVIENYLAQKYGLDANLAVDRYVPADGSFIVSLTGMGTEYDGTIESDCDGLVISDNGGFESGEYIFSAHDGRDNTVALIDKSTAVTNNGVSVAAWNRFWYLDKSDIDGVNANIAFDFSEGINGQNPGEIANYVLLYKATSSADYSVVANGADGIQNGDQIYFSLMDAEIIDGYYTLGTSDETDSPLEGKAARNWYTLISGDWENWEVWTLDPSGALPNNPGMETPLNSDNVYILTGKTVSVDTDNLSHPIVSVEGRLDFQTTVGHSFGEIRGNGRILLAADEFPTGDATHFYTPGQGEGTVEYYGTSFTLNQSRDMNFYNLIINLDAPGETLTLLDNHTINNYLRIEQGTLQINDNSSTTNLTINVSGDITVLSNGNITTGSADARHQLNSYGDFTNEGTVAFTNRGAPGYTSEATNGIVDFNALNTTANQTIQCKNTTIFYRIEIDKGIDQTYILSIEADDAAFFNLYGFANDDTHGSTSQLTDNDNALGLVKGTVRLRTNVDIPVLNNSANYNISEAAQLWVDGGSAEKPNGTAIVVYGTARVSDGTLTASVGSGFTLRENGLIKVEGGNLVATQIRTSVEGVQSLGGYVQTGGDAVVDGYLPSGGTPQSDYYIFSLTYAGNLFSMSGGTLTVKGVRNMADNTGGTSGEWHGGAIFINSDPENINVTGGTVIMDISSNTSTSPETNYKITSKAPFYNVIMRRTDAGSDDIFVLEGGTSGDNQVGEFVTLSGQALVVLNDLKLEGEETTPGSPDIKFYAVTDALNNNDVYIGGSFILEEGTQYIPCFPDWTDGTQNNYNSSATQPTDLNTTYFNQTLGTSSIDTIYWGNNRYYDYDGDTDFEGNENMIEFGHMVVDRTSGNELRLTAPGPGGGNRGNGSLTLDINGDIEVTSGTLDQGRLTIRMWGNVINYDRFGTYYTGGTYPVNGGTPNTAQIRFREDPGLTITTTDNSIFGNTRFNIGQSTPLEFYSDVYIERLEFMRGIIYIGTHNLKVDDMWNLNNENNDEARFFAETPDVSSVLWVSDVGRATAGVANQRIMIITAGNASDGGLTLKINGNTTSNLGDDVRNNLETITYPIGFNQNFELSTWNANTRYRPAQIKVSNFADDGYITIRPASGELQTTDLSSGDELLQNYWRISESDFGVSPLVAYRFYFRDREEAGVVDLPAGALQEDFYVPGFVLDGGTYSRTYESNSSGQEDYDGVYTSTVDANTYYIVFNGNNIGTADDGLFGFSADAPGITLVDANYTAGEADRFMGAPEIFYSRRDDASSSFQNYNWNTNSSWSTDAILKHYGAAASDFPKPGDVAIIGYGNISQPGASSDCDCWTHRISLGGDREVAALVFDSEPTATAKNVRLARVNISPTQTLTASDIRGLGELHVQISGSNLGNIVTTDIGDFIGNKQSSFIYNFTGAPSSNPFVINQFTEYPSVRFYSAGVNSSVNKQYRGTFGSDVTASMFLLDGNSAFEVTNDITVTDTLFIGANRDGELIFPNGIYTHTVSVNEILFESPLFGAANQADNRNKIFVESGGGNGIEHSLIVSGNITMRTGSSEPDAGADFDLYTNSSDNNVILELQGISDAVFKNTTDDTPEFWQILMNKGTDQTYSFTFDDNFTLNKSSDGAVEEKALVLENGSFVLNSNASIDVNSGASSANFFIPSSSALIVNSGSVLMSATSGSTGMLLDGKLEINGGHVDFTGDGTSDNFIQYSASGSAELILNSGNLTVGSQLRRSLTNTEGILNYTQTGGTAIFGYNTAPEGDRGVFELLNAGSNFTHTGGDLILAKGQTGRTVGSLLLDPGSSNISGGTRITFGYGGSREENIVFTDVSSEITVTGNNIEKTSGSTGTWSGVASVQTISEGGYLKVSTTETNHGKVFGLSSVNTDDDYRTIEYGINLSAVGIVNLFESGTKLSSWNGTGGPDMIAYNTSDRFRVEVDGGQIKYYMNSTLLHTSAIAPTLPLIADISLNHYNDPANATLSNIVILTSDIVAITAESFSIDSKIDLRDIELDSLSLCDVEMIIADLVLDSLIIGENTTFDANGLDLTVNGNFIGDGTFDADNNTTYFRGTANQNIFGSPIFYNFTKDITSNTLTLNADITVNNELYLTSGALNDGDNTLNAKGNVWMDATHIWGGTSDGIAFNGTETQVLRSNGGIVEFAKLTINNPGGADSVAVFVPEGNTILIDDVLQMERGILDIGKNLLELDIDAEIIEENVFSAYNMIQTNISFTDAGIKKFFPEITSTTSFIYPIGSNGKYTPVEFSIDAINAGGYIRVKAADEIHPTIINDTEPCDEIIDSLNVLKYHWLLEASNINNFTGDVSMKYAPVDIQIDNSLGTSYDITSYITAKLLLTSILWNKYDANSFDEASELLLFSFSGVDGDGISGDYTAGIEDQDGTCEGAIPDQVPSYVTTADGNWTNQSIWDTYPVSGGSVPVGGPRGAVAIVEHDVVIPSNYILSYKTTIDSGGVNNGIIRVNDTYGHRLGIVDGVGTLQTYRGTLPAGVYDEFFSETGGTLDFAGSDDYDVLSEITQVNNLTFSGTGERRLPNLDLQIVGDLLINGDDITLELINEHNEAIKVKGDIIFDEGSFEAGFGSEAVVVFNGSSSQLVRGVKPFTGTDDFNNIEIDNTAGISLNNPVDLYDHLTFTSGIIYTDVVNILTLKSTADNIVSGAGSGRFVDGPLNKEVGISTSDLFDFPVGNNFRYGNVLIDNLDVSGTYQAQYYNYDPNTDGYDPTVYNSPLEFVSNNEYWRLLGVGGAAANVTLRWDASSGIYSGDTDDIRIAEWKDLATDAWEELDDSNTASGDETFGTVVQNTKFSFNEFATVGNIFTLASVYTPQTLTWDGSESTVWNEPLNWNNNAVPTQLDEIIIPAAMPNDPIISITNAACNAINTLESGATLTINPGAALTVYGDFTNNGDVYILSPTDSNAGGSLIDNGIIYGSGNFFVERYLSSGEYHYVSSPIELGGNANSDLFTTSHSSGNFNPNFFGYDEAYDLDGNEFSSPSGSFEPDSLVPAWYHAHNGDGGAAVDMSIGQGYSFYSTEDMKVTFSGTVNTGSQNIINLSYTNNDPVAGPLPDYYDGWNLVGNPYPSAIDWDLIDDGLTNVENAIYVWDGDQYASYVDGEKGGSMNQDNKIAPMQGFFVHATADNASITLNNSHRIHSSDPFLKADKTKKKDNILELVVHGNDFSDKAVVRIRDNATDHFDPKYDAYKLFSYNPDVPHLYSIAEDGIMYLSVNTLSTNIDSDMIIPLGFKVQNAGNYTLSVDNFEQFDNVNLYFEDVENGVFIPIEMIGDYQFSFDGGTSTDRFFLHLHKNTAPIVSNFIDAIEVFEDELSDIIIDENTFTEIDLGDQITGYEATLVNGEELPEWLVFNSEELTFSSQATNDDVGSYIIKLSAFDKHNAEGFLEFLLTVINVNDAPILMHSPEDQTAYANTDFKYSFKEDVFIDIDEDDLLSYSFDIMSIVGEGSHEWLHFDPESRTFTGMPQNNDEGEISVRVFATDLFGAYSFTDFNITVYSATDINHKELKDITVYPNPAVEGFYLTVPGVKDAIVKLFDLKGSLAKEIKMSSETEYIETANLNKGAYLIEIVSEEAVNYKKLIIR